ncbi:MAG: zinc-dependent alcohol dehydrogenase family protein [Pseudomonadota bacterium]|nr:zinc-dependent alcohol dehydrogenase family protein [Pseudomonadota bacterium]
MRGAQFSRFGDPAEVIGIVDMPDPGPPGPDEVTVRMIAVPVSPSDLLKMSGRYGADPATLPMTPGAEGIGRVVAAGSDVRNVAVGDLVWSPAERSWRQLVQGPARGLIPLPGHGDPLQLAMGRANPLTMWLIATRYVDLRPGDWIIQNAANSACGRRLIGLARDAGWRTVNVVRRADLVDELAGAGGDVVLVDGEDLDGRMLAATGGQQPRLAIDAVSGTATGRLAACVEPGGTVVNYGLLSGEPMIVPAREALFRDVRIRGFWYTPWVQTAPLEEVEQAFRFVAEKVAAGRLDTPVEAVYPLEEVRAAVAHAAREGRRGKIMLRLADG